MMKGILAAFFAICVCMTPAAAEADSKDDKVRRLMELTRAAETTDRIFSAIAPSLEALLKRTPNLKPEHAVKLNQLIIEEFKATSPQFVEKAIPLYANTFTESELDDLIAFYQTPTGQKIITELPTLQKRLFVMGQQWGREAAQAALVKMQAYLKEKGYPL